MGGWGRYVGSIGAMTSSSGVSVRSVLGFDPLAVERFERDISSSFHLQQIAEWIPETRSESKREPMRGVKKPNRCRAISHRDLRSRNRLQFKSGGGSLGDRRQGN